ncbi:MAG TPA: aa3-type cytochrome c oxidase subunit IV [Brevundimonas sp.]|jgi:lipopolysaccharide export LptBFGC system permease protein LptF
MADPHSSNDAADHDAEAYQRGTMAINEQTATWSLVQKLFSWGSLAIAAVLLALVMAFRPGGSIFVGFVCGLIVFIAGFFFLKSGSKKAH